MPRSTNSINRIMNRVSKVAFCAVAAVIFVGCGSYRTDSGKRIFASFIVDNQSSHKVEVCWGGTRERAEPFSNVGGTASLESGESITYTYSYDVEKASDTPGPIYLDYHSAAIVFDDEIRFIDKRAHEHSILDNANYVLGYYLGTKKAKYTDTFTDEDYDYAAQHRL